MMLNDDSVAIDTEESIEPMQPKSDVGFDRIVEYCDTQINKVILGVNLTSNVKSGNITTVEVHNKIRDELAGIDASALEFVIKRAVKFFLKGINGFSDEIKISLIDKAKLDEKSISKAKSVSEIGHELDSEFIEHTFGIKLTKRKSKIVANKISPNKPLDEVDAAMNNGTLSLTNDELSVALSELIKNSLSYESVFKAL